MSELQREQLSAGMDGQLSKDELRFLLRSLDHDEAGRQAWSRYHLAGDALRRQLPPPASAGFAERVMAAVEPPSSASGRMPHWLRWSAGSAIAAGVAAVALMTARPAGEGPGQAPAAATNAVAVADHAAPRAVPADTSTPAAVPPWLLLNDNKAAQYSQQASATLGDGGFGDFSQPYNAPRVSPYQLGRLPVNGDGSYLLLIDAPSSGSAVRERPRQAASAR